MNVNEAVANKALLLAGKNCGEYDFIALISNVNLNKSTNDIFPTLFRIAEIKLLRTLSESCSEL